jgi:hypothetical protein
MIMTKQISYLKIVTRRDMQNPMKLYSRKEMDMFLPYRRVNLLGFWETNKINT